MKTPPAGTETVRQAERALRACLERVPFVKIRNIRRHVREGNTGTDLQIEVGTPTGFHRIVAEVKTSGQPRHARDAVNRILVLRNALRNAYGVFVAPYISDASAEICEKEHVGFVDLSGNCRLCFARVYIEQRGRPNAFHEKRDLRSLYSPKGERILRVLLVHPQRAWKVQDMARETDVSLGQVSNIKRLLGDREWIESGPNGFRLKEPADLLAEWASSYRFRRSRLRECYSLRKPSEMEADLARLCAQRAWKYALTGFSAAARYAPMVRSHGVTAYVEAVDEDVAPLLGLKDVSSGANCTLIYPYDEGVFYGCREVRGVRIVSPVQTYLDLAGWRGRGPEAAEAILREVIRPQW